MFALAMLFNLPPAEIVTVGTSTSPLAEMRSIPTPFFSQFDDISNKFWRKQSCGIASLAMVIAEHHPLARVSPDTLLASGRAIGGYSANGWIHSKLVELAGMNGLHGEAVDLSRSSREDAIASLKEATLTGPVLASVHYKLDASNPIPHLIVVHEVGTSTVTISDPAEKHGDEIVPIKKFEKAWKKRYIAFSEEPLEKFAR